MAQSIMFRSDLLDAAFNLVSCHGEPVYIAIVGHRATDKRSGKVLIDLSIYDTCLGLDADVDYDLGFVGQAEDFGYSPN